MTQTFAFDSIVGLQVDRFSSEKAVVGASR